MSKSYSTRPDLFKLIEINISGKHYATVLCTKFLFLSIVVLD